LRTQLLTLTVVFATLLGALNGRAQGSNVVISFVTSNATPLNLGFAGFSTEILDSGLEYDNTNFQALAQTLSPGWLRYPGGTSDDAFNWSTGLTDTNMINVMIAHGDTNPANSCQFTYQPLIGKGGAQFTNFARLSQNVGGAKIIAIVNCFTDTTNSAAAFAAYALSNHIPVAAWELCNEPYLFQGSNDFFTNGTDYCNKMLSYRNAIKSADPNAQVAVFYGDPASTGPSWDNLLNKYTNKFWDIISYHYYPNPSGLTNFSDLMAYDNGFLFSNTTAYVTNFLVLSNPPTMKYMVTEFQPVQGSGAGTGNQSPNEPSMTLYGGIYASEFIMRMSTLPQMLFVGNFQLFNQNGIYATNINRQAVTTAYANGYVTNTQNLSFGFYLSAQVTAEAVGYWAINRSTAVYSTSVSTNCPSVPMSTNYNAFMPAIYAQAYQGDNGQRYVVLANKSTNTIFVQITQDGGTLTNTQFQETFVSGNPNATNSSPTNSPVQIQTATVTNVVTIPQYSVVRLEWPAFSVPTPTLALTTANQSQQLQWNGVTNAVYNVQGETSLNGTWTTLGRVANTQTNFTFTNWSTNAQQYYRIAVP
jgi:hypothetical protein